MPPDSCSEMHLRSKNLWSPDEGPLDTPENGGSTTVTSLHANVQEVPASGIGSALFRSNFRSLHVPGGPVDVMDVAGGPVVRGLPGRSLVPPWIPTCLLSCPAFPSLLFSQIIAVLF